MLTVQINPVQIMNQQGTQLSTYIIHYDLDAQNCTAFWMLKDSNGNRLYEGNYNVPVDVLINWGSDDNVIIQAVADGLGFTIINPE